MVSGDPMASYCRVTYIESRLVTKVLGLLDRDDWKLEHHGKEPVPAQLLGDAAHYEFVEDGADEKSDEHGDGLREMG